MSETTPTTDESTGLDRDEDGFLYKIGDKIEIPCDGGKFVAMVVKRYTSLDDACEQYENSFRTILQSRFGKAKPNQNFYFCEVSNSTRKPLGVAEKHAKLKWRAPAEG